METAGHPLGNASPGGYDQFMINRLPGLSLPERAWSTVRRWAVAWWRILYLGAVVLVLLLSPSSYGRATRRICRR